MQCDVSTADKINKLKILTYIKDWRSEIRLKRHSGPLGHQIANFVHNGMFRRRINRNGDVDQARRCGLDVELESVQPKRGDFSIHPQ